MRLGIKHACISWFDLAVNACVLFVFVTAPKPSDAIKYLGVSKHAVLKYPQDVTTADILCSAQETWKTLTPSVSAEKNPQKKYFGSDKISEIVNDSDSDGYNFTELSDSDTCIADSPFSSSSSSEEEEVVQPEPDRGRKRSRRALPKRANTDFDLGWKEKIRMVQKPAFSGVPGMNKNFNITQDSSPWDIFEIFFTPEMFKLMQK